MGRVGGVRALRRQIEDYDGTTFRSRWQAFRGNGKKPRAVPTTVTLPRPGARVAVRLVDIFGNDAAAVVAAKGQQRAPDEREDPAEASGRR